MAGSLQSQSNVLSNTKMHLDKKEFWNVFFVVCGETAKQNNPLSYIGITSWKEHKTVLLSLEGYV